MVKNAERLLKKAEKAKQDGPEAVLNVLGDLVEAQTSDVTSSLALCWILNHDVLPPDETARLFDACLDAHPEHDWLAIKIGDCLEAARDIDDLNAAPSDASVFGKLMTRLRQIDLANTDPDRTSEILSALATTARLMARQHDDVAERTYKRLLELAPDSSDAHYSYGLFCKTRGHFAEGVTANRRAIELHPSGGSEAARWNLGICATGAGDGQTAIEVWRAMGNKLELADSVACPKAAIPPARSASPSIRSPNADLTTTIPVFRKTSGSSASAPVMASCAA